MAIRECLHPLSVPAFLLLLMIVVSSCVLFWIEEHFADDDVGPAFESIPHAMWFSIVTISTVGYGDVSPNSVIGKFAASGLIVWGVCYTAMPLAIIGGIFTQVWRDRDKILLVLKVKRKFTEHGLTREILKRLLHTSADIDHDGKIDQTEFLKFLTDVNSGLCRKQLLRLFRCIDESGSKSVSIDQFCDFFFPECELDEDEAANAITKSICYNYHEDINPQRNSHQEFEARLGRLEGVLDGLAKDVDDKFSGCPQSDASPAGPIREDVPVTKKQNLKGKRTKSKLLQSQATTNW